MGASIVKALKADSQTRCIPVLLLEGLLDIEQVAKECGADAYLRTPIGSKEFVDKVRGLIEAGSA
jgi:response regulator RpfG family c-di-GMP phosphodiesterase